MRLTKAHQTCYIEYSYYMYVKWSARAVNLLIETLGALVSMNGGKGSCLAWV